MKIIQFKFHFPNLKIAWAIDENACPYFCQSCPNGKTECLTCPDQINNFRVASPTSTKVCLCMENYFDDGQNKKCLPCHQSCKNCSGPSDNQCIDCSTLNNREFNSATKRCLCKNPYIEINNQCQISCNEKCETCDQNNQNICLTCKSTDGWQKDNQSQTCVCKSEYFYNSASRNCEKCANNCIQCDNISTCKVCKEGYVLYNNICKNCHYSCQQCTGIYSNQCITCNVTFGNRQIDQGTCKCYDGFQEINQYCVQKCNDKCLTCDININVNECLSCRQTEGWQTDDANKTCSCKDYYTFNSLTKGCDRCLQNCKSCTNKQICKICDNGYFLQNDICVPCHYSCLTCIGQSANQCQTCSMNYGERILNSNNECKCKDEYEEKNNQCVKKCNEKCLSCDQNDINNCLSCRTTEGWIQDVANKSCVCQNSYFYNSTNKLCEKCPQNCKKCDTRLICIECQEKFVLDVNKSCKQFCHYSCLNCIGSAENECSDCSTKFGLRVKDLNGYCKCQDGFEEVNKYCVQKCNDYCLTCDQNNINQCLTCRITEGWIKNEINNTCSCKSYYFYNISTKECEKCPVNCKSCSNSTNCTECSDGFAIVGKDCQQCHYSCQSCSGIGQNQCDTCSSSSGQRIKDVNGFCKCNNDYEEQNQYCIVKCDQKCLSCDQNDKNKCLTCKNTEGWIKDDSNGTCICKDGYFYNQLSNSCEICSQNCKSCKEKQNQCSSCFSHYTLSNNYECIACHYSCKECSNHLEDSCISCQQNRQLSNGKCPCQDTFYEQNQICIQTSCNYPCQTCNSQNPNQCKSCYQDQILDQVNLKCNCKDGTYFSSSTKTCNKCSESCLMCKEEGFNQCTECNPQHFRELNQQNECKCKQDYEEQGQFICKKKEQTVCNANCLTCSISNPNICLSCKVDEMKKIDKVTNKCVCIEGYYLENDTNICQKCSNNCKTCKDFNNYCLTCESKYVLSIENVCSMEILPSNIPKEQIEKFINSTQTVTYIAVGTTTAGSALISIASPNGGFVQQFISLQKIYFLLLIDIAYPQLIYAFFKSLGGSNPLYMFQNMNIFDRFIKEPDNIQNNSKSNFISNDNTYKNLKTQRVLASHVYEYIPRKFEAEKINSSVIINSGGPIVLFILVWIFFLPIFIFNYYKNKNSYNFLQDRKLKEQDTQFIDLSQSNISINKNNNNNNISLQEKIFKLYKRICCILLVMSHEMLTIVLSFSVALQLVSFVHFDFEIHKRMLKLIFMISITFYFIFFLIQTYKMVNSYANIFTPRHQTNYEVPFQSIENQIYNIHIEDYIQVRFFSRNFKLIMILSENILVPIILTVFYKHYICQVGLWLTIQVFTCALSIYLRPSKQKLNNLRLIIDQLVWIAILVIILLFGFVLQDFTDHSQLNNEEIQTIDKYSLAMTTCIFIILFLNPIIMIAKLILFAPKLIQLIQQYIQKRKQQNEENSLNKQLNISNEQREQVNSEADINLLEKQISIINLQDKNQPRKPIRKIKTNIMPNNIDKVLHSQKSHIFLNNQQNKKLVRIQLGEFTPTNKIKKAKSYPKNFQQSPFSLNKENSIENEQSQKNDQILDN